MPALAVPPRSRDKAMLTSFTAPESCHAEPGRDDVARNHFVLATDTCSMPSLSGNVSIAAPAERVWHAVLEDLAGMPSWARYLKSAATEDGAAPGQGKKIRLRIDAPGDISLVMLPEVWDRPRRASGRFVDGPVSGTWSYAFAPAGAGTELTYGMDVKLGGMLRFASGMIQGRLESGLQDAMRRLKEQLEHPEGGTEAAAP